MKRRELGAVILLAAVLAAGLWFVIADKRAAVEPAAKINIPEKQSENTQAGTVEQKPKETVVKKPVKLVELNDELLLGSLFNYKELTVFPIYRKKEEPEVDYITLDEGLKSKQIIITEQKGGGSVPKLIIENKGDRPLYIMAGEVVYGGKQDRIIDRDIIIVEHSKPQPLEVLCVESGRWNKKTVHFSSSKSLAQLSVRQAAGVKRSQGKVWAKVAKQNMKVAEVVKRLKKEKWTRFPTKGISLPCLVGGSQG